MPFAVEEPPITSLMNRLKAERRALSGEVKIEFSKADDNRGNLVAGEEMAVYGVRRGPKKASAKKKK